jgi:biopolymer transport protein ExbD
MPIEKPGRRLFKQIRLRKVKKSLTSKGGRSVVASLNLTAMIDMFTVLVTFLMMLFNTTGDILAADKDIKMPVAFHHSALQRALLIQISPLALKLEGKVLIGQQDPAEMKNLADEKANPEAIMKPLVEGLNQHREAFLKKNPEKKDEPQEVIIQADSSVPYIVITRVMKACADKLYQKINLAIDAESGE